MSNENESSSQAPPTFLSQNEDDDWNLAKFDSLDALNNKKLNIRNGNGRGLVFNSFNSQSNEHSKDKLL